MNELFILLILAAAFTAINFIAGIITTYFMMFEEKRFYFTTKKLVRIGKYTRVKYEPILTYAAENKVNQKANICCGNPLDRVC